MIGTTIGKYEVLEEIGRGGMAVVYRGYDRELEREVAIKILHPHLSSQPESKRRFHREARAVARLRFPNILEIFDYSGRDSDQAYIVTEFIHGDTLRRFCEEHLDMPTEVAALIAAEVCRGLRHAHQNLVIHRDIKPENIMIRSDGVVKITDFGIAQMAGTTQMTMTGQILGSPAHMSPEHVENKPLDFRADIFSLGTLLYWMCTGRLPFEGRNPHAVIKRIVEGDFPDPLRVKPVVGDRMAAIIRRCLEVDPDERYQTIDEVIEQLEAFLKDIDVRVTGRELRLYFRDPVQYAEAHREKMLKVLIRRGKEERREKHFPQALHYFNRVLSIDETNEEVLALVERMTSRNKWRRILETTAVALTVLAAISAVVYGIWGSALSNGGDDTRDSGSTLVGVTTDGGTLERPDVTGVTDASGASNISKVDSGAPDGADQIEKMSQDGSHGQSDDAGSNGSKASSSSSSTRTRLVRVVPDPPAARVIIDGQDHGPYGSELVKGIALGVGMHEATFIPIENAKAKCRFDRLDFSFFVKAAAPDAGLKVFPRSLPFRPATVVITSKTPAAQVQVHQRESSPANRVFRVKLDECEERVKIYVNAEGYRGVVLEGVVLKSGREYSRVVNLEPETQAGGLVNNTTP